ncbi:MAG: RlmE family RNA methyltransferase [Desulfobacteraceae bacterium]|nr:RlmE family RNA methyltransferase [Desulfobacteraceae bacterium]
MAARKKAGKPGNRVVKKSGPKWADHLTRQARAENYPARSVYKLKEIQQKFHIIKKKDTVLDLGCAPGSWLLYAAGQVGPEGRILGIDLKPVDIALPAHVTVVQDDILTMEDDRFLQQASGCRVVLSDMAPATTGRKDVDALRSFELCKMALEVVERCLAVNGDFVCKIFQGNEFSVFEKQVAKKFEECRIFKPDSCRKQSKEIYIIAKNKR